MQKRLHLVIGALILVSIFIFISNNFPQLRFISSPIQNIFSFPKSILYGLMTDVFKSDSEQVKRLKADNAALVKKLIDQERTKRDNEALSSQFEIGTRINYRIMPARVIGFLGRFSFPSTLIVDKGIESGIKKDMAVVFQDNLAGKVKEVSGNFSEIELTVNSSFSSLGKTAEGSVPGVIKGQEDFILFDQVAISDSLREGDLILTKGEVNSQGYGIPPDLVIGKINSINRNESLPFQTAKIESRIQFAKLDTLFIILGL